ncbi:MAG: hypothetical protein ACLQVI_18385 [Polyangiaceae bacterium]
MIPFRIRHRIFRVSLLPLAPFAFVLFASAANAQPTYRWDDIPPLPDAPAPAPPEPPYAHFGAQGQVVLDSATDVGVSSTQFDASAASLFSAAFSPSISYFVRRNFSIGLNAGVSYADTKGYSADGSLVETKSTSIYAGPRFGLNVPLGQAASWWLTASLGIESNQTTESLVSGSTVSTSSSSGAAATNQVGPWVDLYFPLLLHPAPHFFMGAGPYLFHDFGAVQGATNGSDQRTTVGASFVVGGYWGGTPEPETTPAPAPSVAPTASAPLQRFGERGEVLLSSELVANVSSTTYAGTSASASSGSFAVGADYFFVDHVSMGAAVNAGWSNSTVPDASSNPVTDSSTSYGISFRVGVEIPLANALSLYPRATIGVENGSADEQSSTGQDAYSFSEVWASGYLPLIVRVAPHLFAGFGPSATRDLSNTLTFPQGQQVSNPGTSLGAGFIVGGWL